MTTRSRLASTSLEAEFQCRHCQTRTWRHGGQARFGRHLHEKHGLDRGPFPIVAHVDTSGLVVDFEQKPVMTGAGRSKRQATPPDEGIDGLIRSVPTRYRYNERTEL